MNPAVIDALSIYMLLAYTLRGYQPLPAISCLKQRDAFAINAKSPETLDYWVFGLLLGPPLNPRRYGISRGSLLRGWRGTVCRLLSNAESDRLFHCWCHDGKG